MANIKKYLDCLPKREIEEKGLEEATKEELDTYVGNKIREQTNLDRQKKIQAIIVDDLISFMESYRDAKDRVNPKAALNAILAIDRQEKGGRSPVDMRIRAVHGWAHTQINDMMEDLVPSWLGFRTKKDNQRKLVQAIFGETDELGDATEYIKFAKSWKKLTEAMRVRFNQAGGDIGFLEDWNLPQRHDTFAIKKATFEKWYDDIVGMLDFDKMDLKAKDRKRVLKEVYDNIVSEGIYGRTKKGAKKGKLKVANRHQHARYLKFKNANAWLEYNKRYSGASPYSVMMDHINMMANEIGLMESLGPNPRAGFEALLAHAEEMTGGPVGGKLANPQYIFDELAGNTAAEMGNQRWADIGQIVRNVETFSKLGGAAIAAIPDPVFNSMTAVWNGVSGLRVMKRFISGLSYRVAKDRKLAARLWMPMDVLLDEAHSANRFADVAGSGVTARLATAVMRGSGLNIWTYAGKQAFHIEFMRALADENVTRNTRIMKAMKKYGIDDEAVRVIMGSKKLVVDGVRYIDPEALPREVAENVLAMVSGEAKYAVLEGDAFVKAIMHQGTSKGTVGGESLRQAGMFKTFSVSMLANHFTRAFNGRENAALYLGKMFLLSGAAGMLVVQAKEIAAGREPIDWDNPELMKKGFVAGGSLPYLGDLLMMSDDDFRARLADVIVGPAVGDLNKMKNIALDAYLTDKSGKELAGKVAVFGLDMAPGTWQTRIIVDRTLRQAAKEIADPEYAIREARRERERMEKFGNTRWW